MSKKRPKLTEEELRDLFRDNPLCPKIASPQQFGDALGVSRKTIYWWIDLGRLDGTYRKRGKHYFILRDKAIAALISGPEWNSEG